MLNIAVAADGTLYITDADNNRVRKGRGSRCVIAAEAGCTGSRDGGDDSVGGNVPDPRVPRIGNVQVPRLVRGHAA